MCTRLVATFLSNQTFSPGRKANHHHCDSCVFNLNPIVVSFGRYERHNGSLANSDLVQNLAGTAVEDV